MSQTWIYHHGVEPTLSKWQNFYLLLKYFSTHKNHKNNHGHGYCIVWLCVLKIHQYPVKLYYMMAKLIKYKISKVYTYLKLQVVKIWCNRWLATFVSTAFSGIKMNIRACITSYKILFKVVIKIIMKFIFNCAKT